MIARAEAGVFGGPSHKLARGLVQPSGLGINDQDTVVAMWIQPQTIALQPGQLTRRHPVVITIHQLIHELAPTDACSAQFGDCGAQQSAWSPDMSM